MTRDQKKKQNEIGEPIQKRQLSPGKTQRIEVAEQPSGKQSVRTNAEPRQPFLSPLAAGIEQRQVQAKAGALEADTSRVHAAASQGVAGSGQALPHIAKIQESFGEHDVTGVRAHVGGEASKAASSMGARAYATGNDVAFAEQPDLHTAAHEAAHVIQQRAGVVQAKLEGGVGREGDQFEQHADRVADLVVAGKSAVGTLSEMAGTAGGSSSSVQRKGKKPATTAKITGVKVVDGEAHVTINKGSNDGIVPGTTGKTKTADLTVYDVGEDSSKATTGTGLDNATSDKNVTDLKIPKESKKEKRRRKRALEVTATPESKTKDGVKFLIRVKKTWMFNTYWRVELLNDAGGARAVGTVVPASDYSERARLIFPIRTFPNRKMQVRLIPYFKKKKGGP